MYRDWDNYESFDITAHAIYASQMSWALLSTYIAACVIHAVPANPSMSREAIESRIKPVAMNRTVARESNHCVAAVNNPISLTA
eukprot:COSAG01_NODE_6865_length_3464_cov_50.271620_4_plen_84_part_00